MNYCSPTKNADNICFDIESLVAIAKEFNNWNKKLCNKTRCINISKIKNLKELELDKVELFNVLKNKLKNLCSNEYCWADLDFINNIKDKKIRDDIKYFTFKPQGTKDVNVWLNTNDINNIVIQYEKETNDTYGKNTFKYLGAEPSDIYKFKKYDFKKLKNKYLQFAIIFNNDTHNLPGSHWIAVYIDNLKKTIEYFDSLAKNPNKYIKGFLNKFKEYKLIINKVKHQYKGSQCGTYACHFIIQKLQGKTFAEINSRILTDEIMIEKRKQLFRPKM